MGNPIKSNILKTGATVWYAPEGEALPDETSVNYGAAWGGNWARVGYTSAPLALILDEERMEVHVQELLAAVDEWTTSSSARFETTLAELTADYLALLFGGTVTTTAAGTGQKGYEELNIGGNAKPTVYAVGFEGFRFDSANAKQPVRFFLTRAVFKINGNLEFSQRNDNYIQVPILARGLAADPDNSDDSLVKFQRVTAPATG